MEKTVSDNTKIADSQVLLILFGLLSIFSFIHFLHIEESLGLDKLMLLIISGFVVYNLMPSFYRLPLLFSLTMLGFFVLFSPLDASLLIAFGLLLFTVVSLPFTVKWRALILLLFGGLLAAFRISLLPLIHQEVIIPVLGGVFMFRSILYLYEDRFAKTSANIWLRLNYFFLLPNLIFLIFPVVDYKTFISSYYTKPAYQQYLKGVLWMVNGVFHLFLYRLIYFYLIPNPKEILDVYTWLQFVVASYALIVRLAGIFHFSAGVICLFGFDLPPTFNHYFFANSFNDLWRRINMYWRDFVMKVFYYPIYFKVKKLGTIKAIVISILLTFVVNWLLHVYQWFWIRGTFLFTIQDVTFWVVFGIAVAVNSVYQAKHKRKKKNKQVFDPKASLINSFKVIGVFSFMAFLWSWWTSPSVGVWLSLLAVWKTITIEQVSYLGLGVGLLALAGVAIDYGYYHYQQSDKNLVKSLPLQLSLVASALLLFSLIGFPSLKQPLEQWSALDLSPIIKTELNAADIDAQFQGYYETMLDDNSLLDSPLTELKASKPENWGQLHETGAFERVDGIIAKRIKPNLDVIFKEENFRTNAFGLHDYPVSKKTPKHILRIALLGGSLEMGSGVKIAETYENVLTHYLNQEKTFHPYQEVEIVNFGISGTHLFQHLARLEQVIPSFDPAVVIYTAHSDEVQRAISNLYRIHKSGTKIPYPYLADLLENLPKEALKSELNFHRALDKHTWNIMAYGLASIKKQAESMNAISIWMFVPALGSRENLVENERLFQLVDSLEIATLDMRGFFAEEERESLILRPWDRHPSVEGHRRIAQKALQEIKNKPELVEAILKKHQAQ